MTVQIIQGNALHLPLEDNSVDLICTSPPYFSLRSYTDNGEHYEGQLGSEASPSEFVDALVAATAEMARVCKPSGSIFVNLGDSYSGKPSSDGTGRRDKAGGRGERPRRAAPQMTREDAAWLAGVVDSDGSIGIHVNKQPEGRSPSFVPWVRIGQMRPEVVHQAALITGTGQVMQDGRGVWNWSASAQQARWVLERIHPWLLIKKRPAWAAIELARHVKDRNTKGSWRPLTTEDVAYRQQLKEAVNDWNKGRPNGLEPTDPGTIGLPIWPTTAPGKSLHLTPHLYALRCIHELGLILRAEICWAKPNGLPESVTDRVRRSHEFWFHFSLQPRYYSAVDTIREATTEPGRVQKRYGVGYAQGERRALGVRVDKPTLESPGYNPLGKLPSSVWTTNEGTSLVRSVLTAVSEGGITIDEGERILAWTHESASCHTLTSNPTAAGSGSDGATHAGTARPPRSAGEVRTGRTESPISSSPDPSQTASPSTTHAATSDASTLTTSSPSRAVRTSGEPIPSGPSVATATTSQTPTSTSHQPASPTRSAGHAPSPESDAGESVWVVPTQPLKVPPELGIDHFAAFPMEFPRRIIQGWSPSGICTACGQGRRPVIDKQPDYHRGNSRMGAHTRRDNRRNGEHTGKIADAVEYRDRVTLTGESCACDSPTAPTRRAVVVDPFGGTGTVALVAHALGRHGISVDMSADYNRLATWRCNDPAQIAAAMQVEKPAPVADDQLGFDFEEAAS